MDTKLPWSVIFQKLEILDVSFVFDHVLVSDSTLENIFIGFAQRAQAAERAKAGSSPSRSRHVFFAMSSRATTTAT
ncbi:hypothetical protein HPB48_010976 [Haemaphysalis longicornis]|uniref:Uncharacterized protein n=1 Tax=Haemaphysalis longicornis TaxID=44386 RepID=A0A9J6GQ02_HAELO|nr:hypothetical protein HPB48_010976 [Haemaphysalis longicornis]